MQLGKSLLGAIVGAIVGIVLLIIVYLTTGRDWAWLSIPFALVTGLGVRMFVDTRGHASYLRGALTMVIALAAYIGGWLLVAPIVMARAKTPEKPAVNAAAKAAEEAGTEEAKDADATAGESKDAEGKDTETKDASATPKAAPPKAAPRTADSAMPRATTPRPVTYSPTDIICLAIAALVAYELGRGSGVSAASSPAPSSIPAGTHPDA